MAYRVVREIDGESFILNEEDLILETNRFAEKDLIRLQKKLDEHFVNHGMTIKNIETGNQIRIEPRIRWNFKEFVIDGDITRPFDLGEIKDEDDEEKQTVDQE